MGRVKRRTLGSGARSRVRHAWRLVSLLAEVAVPRTVFQEELGTDWQVMSSAWQKEEGFSYWLG